MSTVNDPMGAQPVPPEGDHYWLEDDGDSINLVVRTYSTAALLLYFFGGVCFLAWIAFAGPSSIFSVFVGCLALLMLVRGLNALLGIEVLSICGDSVAYEQRLVIPVKRRRYPRSECHSLRVYQKGRRLEPTRHLFHLGLNEGPLQLDTPQGRLSIGTSLSKLEAMKVCEFVLEKCPDLGPRT